MQVLLCYALFIKLVYKLLLSVACMHEGKKSTAAPYRSRHVANLPTKHCISAGQNSVYLYAVVVASGCRVLVIQAYMLTICCNLMCKVKKKTS